MINGVTRRGLLTGTAGLLALAGCGSDTGKTTGREVRWRHDFAAEPVHPTAAANVVVAGDRVLVSHKGRLLGYAAATGDPAWETNQGTLRLFNAHPPIVDGNTLLMLTDATLKGELRAFQPATGSMRWKYGGYQDSIGMHLNWPAAAGGVACYSGLGYLGAVDIRTGRELWTKKARTQFPEPFGEPVMTPDTIWLPSAAGSITAWAARTGKNRWVAGDVTAGAGETRLGLGGGTVVSRSGGTVIARAADTGKKRWSATEDGAGSGGQHPIVTADAVLLTDNVGTTGTNAVVALSLADGTSRWKFPTETRITGDITAAGGSVYVPTEGALHALDPATGRPRWTLRSGKALFSNAAVSSDLVHVLAMSPDEDVQDSLLAIPR
ncbi:PQQ-binding-like beta-propeller repeat protein [Actinoplanes sp. N902-109]|uniref:outer membrane protein assembly factor BamB family protein n=1 Tax=Actinoplanes sp. (strain N902-109) TaxID=649831 RepID=UPI00032945F7|nr:PQQ-binding-like beta-propeller repeat protein [Actinoplanes sp. N902-109]AGL15574.1 Pyrrolo-quinoline quinone [Actinoplanes sp. N902-109]